jgi:hypothetical protein
LSFELYSQCITAVRAALPIVPDRSDVSCIIKIFVKPNLQKQYRQLIRLEPNSFLLYLSVFGENREGI